MNQRQIQLENIEHMTVKQINKTPQNHLFKGIVLQATGSDLVVSHHVSQEDKLQCRPKQRPEGKGHGWAGTRGKQRLGWSGTRSGQRPGVDRGHGWTEVGVGMCQGWVEVRGGQIMGWSGTRGGQMLVWARAMGEQRLGWVCASRTMGGQRPSVGGGQRQAGAMGGQRSRVCRGQGQARSRSGQWLDWEPASTSDIQLP